MGEMIIWYGVNHPIPIIATKIYTIQYYFYYINKGEKHDIQRRT